MSKNLTLVVIFIILALLLVITFATFQNQLLIKRLTEQRIHNEQTMPSKTEKGQSKYYSPSPTPPQPLTLAALQNVVKSDINSKNYSGLIPFMVTPHVDFAIMSSECCQPKTPDDAAASLKYIEDGLPIDFNQQTDIVKTLKAKNHQLQNAFIGISTTKEHLVAVTTDQNNKITSILVSLSWKYFNY